MNYELSISDCQPLHIFAPVWDKFSTVTGLAFNISLPAQRYARTIGLLVVARWPSVCHKPVICQELVILL